MDVGFSGPRFPRAAATAVVCDLFSSLVIVVIIVLDIIPPPARELMALPHLLPPTDVH